MRNAATLPRAVLDGLGCCWRVDEPRFELDLELPPLTSMLLADGRAVLGPWIWLVLIESDVLLEAA